MNIGENSQREKIFSKNNLYIFIAIVIVKLVVMSLFSSDYQNRMFIPFVSTFIHGNNPYEFYYQNNMLDSFPYFPLMLLIESLGAITIDVFGIENIILRNIVFKIPLLIFDIVCFVFISKMGVKFKYNIILFFCSPIIFYGTYIHSQLDIIPTTLLVIAVYYVVNCNRSEKMFYFYALFLGLALSTKFHIIAAVPILFIYVYKKRDFFYSVKIHCIAIFIVTCFVFAFWGDGFINKVLLNKEQSVLFDVIMDYNSTQIIIPILALLFFYLMILELNYFNKNLLIASMSLVFSIFLICISPMPAWFIWAVPFIVVYFSIMEENKYNLLWIFAVFNVVYILYFLCFHETQFVDVFFVNQSLQNIKIHNNPIKYVTFTALVASLIVVVVKIYTSGLASNNLYKRKNKSFVIGISGDSGAGKSTLLRGISNIINSEKDVLFIEGDGDHKWERGNDNWNSYTALNPQANYLYRQADDIRRLKNGGSVERAEYDHDTGTFTPKSKIHTKKYIVLSGLHSLYLPQLRRELDLKIFMDTDDSLRKKWKFKRDSEERGYSYEEVEKQIQKRNPDSIKYIEPQKKFADFVIHYYANTDTNKKYDDDNQELCVGFELNIDFDVEPLVREFVKYDIFPKWNIHDDLIVQTLDFDGNEIKGKKIDFNLLARKIIPQYDDLFNLSPIWDNGIEGIVQLMVLLMISLKIKE